MKENNRALSTGGEGGGLTLREAAAYGAGRLQPTASKNPTRDAQLLLLHASGLIRTDLLTHPDRALTAAEENRYRDLIARRKQSEPIQYITGEREFYGLRLRVTPDVLIPRPETEHLVEAALERIPLHAAARIVDVGTGSGAIAIAIAVARPLACLVATDVSAAALNVARRNALAHNVADRIEFAVSDLLDGIAAGSVDMVVSNPPYIADAERDSLDAEVRDYEPAAALFAGPTGLEVYERLIPRAARALHPGGWLMMEIGAGQQSHLRRFLEGWQEVGFVPDLQGIARVAIARAPDSGIKLRSYKATVEAV